jgi:predicted nucleic acid-binding protein
LTSLRKYAVVLNTSSLWSFIVTDSTDLLAKFFNPIIIPSSVASEISVEFTLPNEVTVQKLNAGQIVSAETIGLGAGENEAMILARDMRLPLIIDDGDAQRFAEQQLGLEVYGSLEFVRGAFLSCAIEREQFLAYIMSFLSNERANLGQISWASRAEK